MTRFLQARLLHQQLHGRGGLPRLTVRCPHRRTEYFVDRGDVLAQEDVVGGAARAHLAIECPDQSHAFTVGMRPLKR
jgi:hypothetical protein